MVSQHSLLSLRTRFIKNQHYLVDIIDDNSGMAHIHCLRQKSDTLRDAQCTFYDTICRPRGINFFALRMDNGGELVSHEVHEFCASHCIHLVPVPAYRHAWNGVAERFSDTLFCMIHSMIETSHLPGFIRNYAAQHACRLFNDCPKYPTWQTPSFK